MTTTPQTLTNWTVTFAHHWVTLTTHIQARDEDDAVTLADNLLTDYYGWDLSGFSAEANNDNEVTA